MVKLEHEKIIDFSNIVIDDCWMSKEKYLEYQKPTGVIADMSGYQGLISEQFYDITVDEILKN